jgi:hypothetical protein
MAACDVWRQTLCSTRQMILVTGSLRAEKPILRVTSSKYK